MKFRPLHILFFLLGLSLYGCGAASPTSSPTEPVTVQDQASLLEALQSSNAAVEISGSVIQDFFSPEGSIITVNGAEIQVFEYEAAEDMEREASQVSADGGSIGTTMVAWMDPPHFYKTGRIIVIYIGSDENTLKLIQAVMGPQFAGR